MCLNGIVTPEGIWRDGMLNGCRRHQRGQVISAVLPFGSVQSQRFLAAVVDTDYALDKHLSKIVKPTRVS